MSYEYALDPLNSKTLEAENRRAGLLDMYDATPVGHSAVAAAASLEPSSDVVYTQESWERPGYDAVRYKPEQE